MPSLLACVSIDTHVDSKAVAQIASSQEIIEARNCNRELVGPWVPWPPTQNTPHPMDCTKGVGCGLLAHLGSAERQG